MFVPRDGRPRGWAGELVSVLLLGLGLAACNQAAPGTPAVTVVVAPAAAAPPPAPAEPTCGLDGQPECPLQHWMDHHLNGPLSRDDFPALITAFRDLAAASPPGFDGWRPWAQGGAAAAAKHDGEGVRMACKGCHDRYRERYRATLRERPLPAADPP
jgi:hypothetical protein